jgi:hypothetical protein
MVEGAKQTERGGKRTMGLVYTALCWCSGSRLYLLKECPSEWNKHAGMGAIVLFTGFMAGFSGFYALFTIFDSIILSALFGAFWACLIFFLDWYILASMKKENKPMKEIMTALPRFILAVLISVVIARPLEMKLFEKEINQEVIALMRDKSANYKVLVNKEFKELDDLIAQNRKLTAEINEKEQIRDELYNAVIAEAEGRSITKEVGKGPVYREKQIQLARVEQELAELKTRNLKKIESNDTRIAKLQQLQDKEMGEGYQAVNDANGFLARTEAFNSLSIRNQHIGVVNWFIMLLFLVIEVSPVLVKLMLRKGPYDELLDVEERQVRTQLKKTSSEVENNTNYSLNLATEISRLRFKSSLDVAEAKYTALSNARMRLNEAHLKMWEKSQLAKISIDTELLDNAAENRGKDIEPETANNSEKTEKNITD